LATNIFVAPRLYAWIILYFQEHEVFTDFRQPSTASLQKLYRYTTVSIIGFVALLAAGEWIEHSTKKRLTEQTSQTLKPLQWFGPTSERSMDNGILTGAAVLGLAIYSRCRAVWKVASLALLMRVFEAFYFRDPPLTAWVRWLEDWISIG
jgi:hypothetical protein